MAVSNAERQRAYRARHAGDPVERMQVQLPTDLKHWTEMEAARLRVSLADVVRMALEAMRDGAYVRGQTGNAGGSRKRRELSKSKLHGKERYAGDGAPVVPPAEALMQILEKKLWSAALELQLGPILRNRKPLVQGLKTMSEWRSRIPELLSTMQGLPREIRQRIEEVLADAST